jgi:hypothetical protein
MQSFWKSRIKASGIHLGISLVIALLAAALVFGVWYPYPYRVISGGRELFLIVVAVDVILGPLITFTVFSRSKPWSELRRDLMVVVALQLGALVYGIWTVFAARPVHLVFELDRFRVVHAVDVAPQLLPLAPRDLQSLPLAGPTLLSLRPFRSAEESADATIAALQGVPLGSRPDLWQSYGQGVPAVLAAAKPVTALLSRFPIQAKDIGQLLTSAGLQPQGALYLPMVARKNFWTVVIDPASAQPIGFLNVDSF